MHKRTHLYIYCTRFPTQHTTTLMSLATRQKNARKLVKVCGIPHNNVRKYFRGKVIFYVQPAFGLNAACLLPVYITPEMKLLLNYSNLIIIKFFFSRSSFCNTLIYLYMYTKCNWNFGKKFLKFWLRFYTIDELRIRRVV